MRKMLAVARKELRQIARDRLTLTILLVVPLFFLLLYGYALNWDIRHVRLAVDDRDHTPESRSLIAAFVNSGYFDLVASIRDDAEASRLMDRNDVRAILVVPHGLGRAVRTARPVAGMFVDGDNANTAYGMNYALTTPAAIRRATRYIHGPRTPTVSVEPSIWYKPQLRSTLFLVPGLIAYTR